MCMTIEYDTKASAHSHSTDEENSDQLNICVLNECTTAFIKSKIRFKYSKFPFSTQEKV